MTNLTTTIKKIDTDVPQELVDSTSLLHDGKSLQSRLAKDGYLFFRNYLDLVTVEIVAASIRRVLHAADWLAEDSADNSWKCRAAAGCPVEDEIHRRVSADSFKLEEVHSLGHDKKLKHLMVELLRSEILVHPRPFIRLVFPEQFVNSENATTAHQDFVSQQGAVDTLTAWIPISDCPVISGGLAIAEKTHNQGILPFKLSKSPGGMEVADSLAGKWRTTDFRQGDVLVFHSMTVHKALANRSTNLRVSVDFRYQRQSDPINSQCLSLAGSGYDWSDVYSGWSSERLQFYWKQFELSFAPFDLQFLELRDHMAFEGALVNEPFAIRELHRIHRTARAPEKRERAARVLQELGLIPTD